ncbi:MAG TPA: hypothetical protein VNF50_04835 [Acidimicrobiales bacterium]|nr:hypothetical protein [Acidimicrobiales bacterium]
MTAGVWKRLLARHLGGQWPTGDVVDALFRSVLLRPADAPSRRFYVRALGRGVAVDEVVRAVHTSAEAVDNSWRAPLAAGAGPALWEQRVPPGQVYVACPPAGTAGDGSGLWAGLAFGPAPDFPRLVGYDLDQLVWVPPVIRQRAAVVAGPLGVAGRALVDPSARSVLVVARPVGPHASVQARVLASRMDPGRRAWLDYSPETEAGRRGLDVEHPLQALLEAGPEGAGPEDLERDALAALALFDRVVLDGPEVAEDGTGPDWALYRAARTVAAGAPRT